MKYRFENTAILVFAKEPVVGRVKTRLQASLGRQRTLALHQALVAYQYRQIERSELAPLELWVSSNPSHELFTSLCDPERIYLQKGSDLGQRMQDAVASGLTRADSVILVGTDCPSVDPAYLQGAIEQLNRGVEVVLGPAEDGGYVLIGLTGDWSEIFREIPWGSSQVMEKTLQRLECAGLNYNLLETRWDVDRPEDLARLAGLQPPFTY